MQAQAAAGGLVELLVRMMARNSKAGQHAATKALAQLTEGSLINAQKAVWAGALHVMAAFDCARDREFSLAAIALSNAVAGASAVGPCYMSSGTPSFLERLCGGVLFEDVVAEASASMALWSSQGIGSGERSWPRGLSYVDVRDTSPVVGRARDGVPGSAADTVVISTPSSSTWKYGGG
jgi:hypothetical protein